jgi:short-subunit dehydrogenase
MNHPERKIIQKSAIITGGNSGIGLATSIALLDRGYKVIVIDKNISTISSLKNTFQNLYSYECDISNDDDIEKTFQKIHKIADTIDILINSAGIGAISDFDKQELPVFKKVMDINFLGTVRIIKACLPSMVEKRNGHIINISSISGKVTIPQNSSYCCSKGALEGFSESLRIEVKNHNINVSVINPRNVRTQFHNNVLSSGAGNEDNPKSAGMPVDHVVKKIIQVIEKPKRNVYLPLHIEFGAICEAISLPLMDRFYFHCTRKITRSLDTTMVAIVTGAGSGIGKAVASYLCTQGLTVVMIDENKDLVFPAAKEMADLGGNPVPVPCDIRDYETVRQTIHKITMDFGRIDLLITNPCSSVWGKIECVPIKDIISDMETNFYGPVHLVKEVLPIMQREGRGHVISVLSTNAIRGKPYLSSSGATDFALRSFSRCLDREMAKKHNRIKFSEIFHASDEMPSHEGSSSLAEEIIPVIGREEALKKFFLSMEKVAKCVPELVETGKTRKFVSLSSYLLLLLNSLAPSVIDLYFSQLINKNELRGLGSSDTKQLSWPTLLMMVKLKLFKISSHKKY